MAGLWVWTASRAFLKVLVKIIVFMINFCCMCSCEWLMDRRNEKKKGKNRQKKMYTQDLLQIVGNPRYNPISDPAYDIEKYSKLCAGIMLLCEGEVLMLQRHSNNNDRTFDFPGGTIDNEDFEFYYNSLMTRREYKKKLKTTRTNIKVGLQGGAHAVADRVIDRVDNVHDRIANFTHPEQKEHEIIVVGDDEGETQQPIEGSGHYHDENGPLDPYKRPIYPQVPLYDSFYYADIFSSQFQTLGLNSWQHQGHLKRKQLETLYEQATRHYKHGFGFDSSPWHAAVREATEELNYFPSVISPIAVFNIYRGWTELDEDSDGTSESDDSDSDFEVAVDPESQQLITGKDKNAKTQNGKSLNINSSLLGNGKVIGDNFRRYTMYVCSITPEQRNILSANLKLSEEHSEFAWMPLTLLIPMHSTHVSVFKHFRLHPWVIAFIEQYSSQFEKLSRKTFWVGYNRHFDSETPLITDETANVPEGTGKVKKSTKDKEKKKKKNAGAEGNDSQDSKSSRDAEEWDSLQLSTSILGPAGGDNLDRDLDLEFDLKPTTRVQGQGSQIDENDGQDGDDAEVEVEAAGVDVGGGKKKKKKNKENKEGKKSAQKDISSSNSSGFNSDDTSDDPATEADVGAGAGAEHAQFDPNVIQVEPCERDVFISVFLPLVKKFINPKVYL